MDILLYPEQYSSIAVFSDVLRQITATKKLYGRREL